MKITAYAIKKKGGKAEPFSYERSVGKNEVLVRIIHCGIARGDIQAIDDEWGDTKFPFIPGHEIVGLVEETGSEVTGLKMEAVWVLVTSKKLVLPVNFVEKAMSNFALNRR